MTLDTEWVRAQFPGLSSEEVLFDNAGGSVPARHVIDAVTDYLQRDMVQLGASYPRSRRATERVHSAYETAATLFGADAKSIMFGGSTSMNMYVLAQALAPLVQPGDEVIVTELDHEANRGAWVRMAQARGATVKLWRVQEHQLTMAGLEAVLSPRSKVVAFTHCSNVVGALHDAAALCARIREAGALSVVDGVAYAPHRRVDVAAVGADVYALSLYKVYGPHLGAVFLTPEVLGQIRNQNHFFLEGQGSYQLMPGNVCHELAAGVGGVVAYLRALDRHHGGSGSVAGAFDRIAAHEAELVAPLLDFLRQHPRVRLTGPETARATERVPTVAFTVEGMASAELVGALDGHGLGVRYGHFYAYRAMQAFGLSPEDGIVRVSMVHYNTGTEVARLLEALEQLL